MTQIKGTDIWKYELPEPIYPGTESFLFKNTESTWVKKTKNVKVVEGKNLYERKSTGLGQALTKSDFKV